MKHIVRLIAVMVLFLACSGLALAQGYDLLVTGAGTQDNLSSLGLGTVTFQGVPLSSGTNNYETGSADTIVYRSQPVPPNGGTIPIQIVALYLVNSSPVTCTNPACTSGQQVTVYATINAVPEIIPLTVLPQPNGLTESSGTMTVNTNNFTFSTNSLTLQADIIVVPLGQPVTATAIFTAPMPQPDSLSSSGSMWTTIPPPGYPYSQYFPSGGFYVASLGGTGAKVVGIFFRILRPALYGLGLVLFGMAFLRFRSAVSRGQLGMRPAYLLALALIVCLVGWRSPDYAFPTVAQAHSTTAHGRTTRVPPPGVSAYEVGLFAAHGVTPAGQPLQGPTLPEWGVIVMALGLIGFSIWRIRRGRVSGAV